MRSDVFYWVLNMSIHGGLVCLIVLLLRKLPRLPKSLAYGLWCLPALRLLLPFGLDGKWNLMALLEKLGSRSVTIHSAQEMPEEIVSLFAGMNSVGAADSYFPITYGTNALTQLMETAAWIWAVGAAACALTACVLYVCTVSELRDARKMDGFYVSHRVTAPVLLGILRPKIILPPRIDQEDIPYILRHEGIHAARRDNLWRCTAIAVCCVHWFNPVCWLSLQYFFEDMELSCDAAVIRRSSRQEVKRYAHALVNTAQQRSLFLSAFGGAKIALRVQSILSYRKLTAISAAAFVVLFVMVAYVLVTN